MKRSIKSGLGITCILFCLLSLLAPLLLNLTKTSERPAMEPVAILQGKWAASGGVWTPLNVETSIYSHSVDQLGHFVLNFTFTAGQGGVWVTDELFVLSFTVGNSSTSYVNNNWRVPAQLALGVEWQFWAIQTVMSSELRYSIAFIPDPPDLPFIPGFGIEVLFILLALSGVIYVMKRCHLGEKLRNQEVIK